LNVTGVIAGALFALGKGNRACQLVYLFSQIAEPSRVGIWLFDIRALSALIVQGVEPGITWTYSGVYKAHILVIVSLRVCSGPQQNMLFSELTTKREFQHHGNSQSVPKNNN